MLGDKNCQAYAKTVLPYCRRVIAVQPNQLKRALSVEALKDLAGAYCADTVTATSPEDAVALALQSAGEDPIFGFGSLYLAADLRRLFLK